MIKNYRKPFLRALAAVNANLSGGWSNHNIDRKNI